MTDDPHAVPLLQLSDPRARASSVAGGKASALAALCSEYRVPPGFVLTPTAFDGGRLRETAKAALREALTGLEGPVAVRSSGVAEDLADASFAGQYETVLDVEGADAVEAAVERVLASVHAPRLLAYRAERGLGPAPMAVLVQRMVHPRAAGVAFTAHPVTGEREVCVVSAVRGLAEQLVSGEADAEEWEVRDAPSRRRGTTEVLEAVEVSEIAALARRVGRGAPTDIEWAIGADGLCLLQARPMTALPEPVQWAAPPGSGFVRNFRLGEWIGAPVTPLFESWILTDLEERLHAHFDAMMGLRAPRPLHVVVNGWYFYGGMAYDLSLGALLRAMPRLITSLFDRVKRYQILASTPPLARFGFDPELARWRNDLMPGFRAVVERSAESLEAAEPAEVVRRVQAIVDQTGLQLASIVGVAGYAAKAELALILFWRRHLPQHDGVVWDLVSGAPVEPAAHDVEGLDPVFPTSGERGAVPPGPTPEVCARVAAEREAAEARATAALPPKLRARFGALVQEARRAHDARVEQTGLFTLGWPVLRRALLILGDVLVRQGVIPQRTDVFFVSRAELDGALAGDSRPLPVEARRATWERQRDLAPPLVIGEPKGLLKQILAEVSGVLHHAEHDAPDALVGMPGAPGRATGPARVVRSVDDLDRLQAGEVLVAPVTTPLWTLAFGRAIAVVTDTGSVASHASIVAREHGIPAVVGTGDGTRRIADGQRITVDGGRGVVRLAPDGP